MSYDIDGPVTITSLTTDSFIYSGTSGLIASTPAPTDGQILIGSTGVAPVVSTLTGGSGVSITNGAGSITISLSGSGVVTSFSAGTTGFTPSTATTGAVTLAGTLNVGNGGTGLTSIPTNGQILIGNGTNYTLSTISGTANQITVTNGAGTITLSLPSAVTITTSLTISGLTANSFLYSGTAGLLTTTTAPTNGQLLIGSTGVAPVLGTLSGTTGQLTVTNGAGTITLSVAEPFYTTGPNRRAIIGGASGTYTGISGTINGVCVVGGTLMVPTVPSGTAGTVIIGGDSSSGFSAGGSGNVVGATNNATVTINGTANGILGSVSLAGTISGTGCGVLGSSSSSSTISGSGCAVVGGSGTTTALAGTGSVRLGGSVTCSLDGTGNVSIGGSAMNASSIASGNTGSIIAGGTNATYSFSSSNGCLFLGGNSGTSSFTTTNGAIVMGSSFTNTSITSSNGSCVLGGTLGTVTITAGAGSTVIAGEGYAPSVGGRGNIAICASGTIGASSNDRNFVLIGGTNTTLQGNSITTGNPGSISIGPSSQTVLYQPTNAKLYLKDNPITTKLNTTFTTPGTLTAAAVSGGVIQFTTTAGAYTLPTTAALCTELLDTSATAFTGTPRHMFVVTFYNTSGGACTIAMGTGQTLTNGSSPFSIANNQSSSIRMWFTSPTAMLVELIGGVTNISGTSGQIVASASTGAVTLSLAEPLYTSSTRAVISGDTNTLTNVSAASGGGTIGGRLCAPTISSSSGAVMVAGRSNNISYNDGAASLGGLNHTATLGGSGAVIVGGNGHTGSLSNGGALIGGETWAGTGAIGVIVGGKTNSDTLGVSSSVVVIGGNNCSPTLSGLGPVRVGGNAITGTLSGSGAVCIGGQSVAISQSGNGSVIIGGSASSAPTISGVGAVVIPGNGKTLSVVGNGCVGIAAGGTIGSSSADTNNVLIGGNNTTLLGSGTNGHVCIGTRGTVQTFSPTTNQLLLKSNPIFGLLNANVTVPVTLTATQLTNGAINVSAGGANALTFPSATSVYAEAVDNSVTPTFALNMSFFFIVRNQGGGTISFTAGTGNTLLGTTGTLANNLARAGLWVATGSAAATIFLFG